MFFVECFYSSGSATVFFILINHVCSNPFVQLFTTCFFLTFFGFWLNVVLIVFSLLKVNPSTCESNITYKKVFSS